ncbi:type I-B CRISPR-associated protein Cas5b [Anoxybacteroides rupiense]|uniref:type I-B CRISPR-associated protein Cas5b n=1 Tax=Anoxybacteroides rupiense TaxID=311460 RepID=UPI0016062570|nr:type I-B CRISPR-associated protein Cas5b [Anoxybacillus rupiensis]MBB3907758.1 CRISPR-associated protein Cas5h [Anoxybacillus rupiensis]
MKILIFDLVGKMGHFRKIDTNSSSLSYSFPPRTTIAGILAGILGMERDSYYDLFSPQQCQLAVSVRTRVRKMMQTVNYMFVKGKGDFNNSKGHTQIPLEFVLPKEEDHLRYRIYFSHSDRSVYERVRERIQANRYIYPPYLGISELLGQLEWVAEAEGILMESHDLVPIHSVVRVSDLRERSIQFSKETRFLKEFMTRQFINGRMIQATDYYVFEQSRQMVAIPTVPYVAVAYGGEKENILWM